MISIKIATIDDLEIASRMALGAIRKTVHALFSDPGRVHTLAEQILLDRENAVCFLAHSDQECIGILAGIQYQFPFGLAKQAVELVWWVNEEHRASGIGKQLLDAFELWAATKGCRLVTMMDLDNSLDQFYEKNEYKLAERTFLKDLKPWERVT